MNETIRVVFTDAIDLSSGNVGSFRITHIGIGATPSGTFRVDPDRPPVLVWQPSVTFDPSGYAIHVPGTALDPAGPHVLSETGQPNLRRLSCTVVTSLGVLEPQTDTQAGRRPPARRARGLSR